MNTKLVEKEMVKRIKSFPIRYSSNLVSSYSFIGLVFGLVIGLILNYFVFKFVYSNQISDSLLGYIFKDFNSLYRIKGGAVFFDVLIIPIFFSLIGTLIGKKVGNIISKDK